MTRKASWVSTTLTPNGCAEVYRHLAMPSTIAIAVQIPLRQVCFWDGESPTLHRHIFPHTTMW